jgi:hypothetical protein
MSRRDVQILLRYADFGEAEELPEGFKVRVLHEKINGKCPEDRVPQALLPDSNPGGFWRASV